MVNGKSILRLCSLVVYQRTIPLRQGILVKTNSTGIRAKVPADIGRPRQLFKITSFDALDIVARDPKKLGHLRHLHAKFETRSTQVSSNRLEAVLNTFIIACQRFHIAVHAAKIPKRE